jgi:hypothetical protein
MPELRFGNDAKGRDVLLAAGREVVDDVAADLFNL